MPRVVRWVAIAVCCLLGAAPAARADGPTPTITADDRSSPAKGLGSESRDAATGDIIVGDPGPGREPRLITPSPQNLEIALDGPADSLRASLGGVNARVTQTSALTYTVEVPESQALPVFLGLAITSTHGSWTTHAGWGLELARSPAPMFATPWSAAVRPALLSATEGPRTGSVLIADGFGLNPPTLRVAPGAIVTVTLTGWVNGLTAHAGGTPLVPVKVDDTTYTVALPTDLALPARFSVGIDYSTESFWGSAGYTADLAALPVQLPSAPTAQPHPVDSPATLLALRLKGRRLSVSVACSGTCPGVVTLRTSRIRIARLTFAGPGRYTATISRSAQRHLKRSATKRLRAVLTTRGYASRVLTLTVR